MKTYEFTQRFVDVLACFILGLNLNHGINAFIYIVREKIIGENILKLIVKGSFQMGKFRETLAEGALHQGLERDKVFTDLTPKEKDTYKDNIRAINILLQGLSKDIYTFNNHYTDAKDIWDNVKMLLEGSELTKDDRESQLYDEFKHFYQNKGETIHEHYVGFTKLINNIRNIKMTMPKMQLNSKFVNNMLPEWGRFITAVKLNRGLKTSNYDQMYAYLKQHEARANENKMMLEKFTLHAIDPLTLENGVVLNEEHLFFIVGGQANTFDDDVDEAPVQDLALNEDNVFQANQCDVFDSHVDEAPVAQTMFMENLSSADPIYNEVGSSYDSDILSEPWAVIYRDKNNQKKIMRETEVHKFSDGMLKRILEKLDVMVKDFVLFKFNPCMEHRIWSEDDKRRSKEFIEVIEKRLKIRRIFRNLESFVSEFVRDIKYRLIQRAE
nr:putative zinc finger, CCHC-type [Tanacetum cinerariifolium]